MAACTLPAFGQIASDQESDYAAFPDWGETGLPTPDNGQGFGGWSFSDSSNGGFYLGSTGLGGGNAFGVYAGTSSESDYANAQRGFRSGLGVGQTFSIQFGFTQLLAGSVGLILVGNGQITIGEGSGNFQLSAFYGESRFEMTYGNTTDAGTGVAEIANDPYTFSITFLGGSDYTWSLSDADGNSNSETFTFPGAPNGGITAVQVFSVGQGAGANIGFNNLQIVPEPSIAALLLFPVTIGSFLVARRRIARL